MTDLDSFVNKTVEFKFNGAELRFDLSHALFSSFDIDLGTRLLLKAAARDPVLASARRILDEGCGVGVIGLCAAKAFPEAEVVMRDRDSLAVAFAERNRLANKLRGTTAWTDPKSGEERRARPAPRAERGLLGDGGEGGPYDFVFSNLPAKAGAPVLARFFHRLSGKAGPSQDAPRLAPLLVPGGRAGIVIVEPLVDAALSWIAEAGLCLAASERGSMHRAFVVERVAKDADYLVNDETKVEAKELSAYLRGETRFKLGDQSYRAWGFWGLPEFDTPSFGSSVAAELASRVRSSKVLEASSFRDGLFIEAGAGHLVIWASRELGLERVTAASRDELSLRAVGINLTTLPERRRPEYRAIDALSAAELPPDSFDLVVESPDIVPERDWIGPSWELAGRLLRSGGLYLAHCSPTEMTRLEKRRPSAGVRWSLAGQKRKKGAVASAWRKG